MKAMKAMKRRSTRLLAVAGVLALACVGSATAETRIEKNLKLDAGGAFSLRTDLGWIKVRGTDRPGARIVVTSREDDLNDLLRFDFEERPGSVAIVAKKRHSLDGWFSFGRRSVGFEVEIPARTRITINTSGGAISVASMASEAKLETSGGGIEVRDLNGDLDAHTSGGAITLSRVKGHCRVDTSGGGITADAIEGRIEADTSGGSIHMDGVTGDIRAHSSGGGIRIREAGGRVDAETSGGSVQAAFAKGNGRGGRLESSGGGVSVSVDPSVGLAIDASGNSVRADVPITVQGEISRRHLRGNLGAGGETLRVRTSGGSVSIRPL